MTRQETPVTENPDPIVVEARAWLDQHWDPALDRSAWFDLVVDAGWAAPSWDTRWFGRGLSTARSRAVADEFRRVGAPGSGQDRMNLWAATVYAAGSDELKSQVLGGFLRHRLRGCLLYSEPGAGSDLAGLRTRAERDGDEWIVNGQKVWTSFAQKADYGMLVARTDVDVPKHRGLTFFLLPMKQPGVTVRPIHQITGESEFNEVFLDDARVSDTLRVGEVDAGWAVLQLALGLERAIMGGSARTERTKVADPGDIRRMSLRELAVHLGRFDDPVVRQDIARIEAFEAVNRWNLARSKAAGSQAERLSVLSLSKIAMSRILHQSARVYFDLAGPESMLEGPENSLGDATTFRALNAYFTSIGGGTDQIQRNIIGEKVLGLPREPDPFHDRPFRELPHDQG
ncbi:acyl-CoA dehydrogenase [Mycobacterium sp. djl-10]|nr:acyl-CoA dehydrogenase [Mycobacterium sp. djl-10]